MNVRRGLNEGAASGCLFLTGVLAAWAILLFFVARYLLGLAVSPLGLADFEIALLATVVAIGAAIAVAATLAD